MITGVFNSGGRDFRFPILTAAPPSGLESRPGAPLGSERADPDPPCPVKTEKNRI